MDKKSMLLKARMKDRNSILENLKQIIIAILIESSHASEGERLNKGNFA